MKTTLLIMAAGIGSRFGTGIKQLEPVDASNHIIMDYSIHDAIEAGFNHVVFIIRKDIEKEFKEVIGNRITSICSAHNVTVDYAFQNINDIPGTLPEGRTKPWGTGQAMLAAKKVLDTPFIVINADDYYGKEGFKAVHEYLVNGGKSCMAGFVLKNTLSDNGGVTRGICKMDDQNNLTEVVETKNIVKTADAYEPIHAGKGWKSAIVTWYQKFKESVFFRKLFFLSLVTSLVLFRTLLNRNLWMNPLSDVMGGWGIWETVNGEQKLTTECIENVIMMVPFSSVAMWTFGEKIGNGWKKILWQSGKIAFIFSVSIEMLQLLLRLGTFQLSDIFYNTVGGVLGGLVYYGIVKARKRL